MLKDFDAADYTQTDLASALNVHFNTVANYKRGFEPKWRNGHALVELYKRVFSRDPPVVIAST